MVDKDFYNKNNLEKVSQLRANISAITRSEITDSLFRHILDYVSLNRQYFIDMYTDIISFNNNVFNGYIIEDTSAKYLIRRYSVVPITNNLIVGYKQNKKSLYQNKILSKDSMKVMVGFCDEKGYYKNNKDAIHLRTARLIFFKEAAI